MKILYSVQATGNGHISRALQLTPYLRELGQVDIFLSGSNYQLETTLPIKYRSKGLSLYTNSCGQMDYLKTVKNIRLAGIRSEARSLPVEKYDLIINDFESITSLACKWKGVPSIHLGHQASFISPLTPRPDKRSIIGEFVLKNYATATHNIGLHFRRYADFIFPPIIKQTFLNAQPEDLGHVTVYLPSYDFDCLKTIFESHQERHFHWFLPGIFSVYTSKNVTYFPIDTKYFNQSLINCHALVTGGGFETPAEGLYMKKKVLSIPISGHYEQQSNAKALSDLGIKTLKILNKTTQNEFFRWLEAPAIPCEMPAADIPQILQYMLNISTSTSMYSDYGVQHI
ncbi:MAG: glycosyltransferase family protein [Saprospiraceae bacterium]